MVAMNLEKWILQTQLKNEGESMPIIWSLISATESDALLVVDKANSSLKCVNLSSGTIEVLYRSSDTYSLRDATFFADAQNKMHTLLLVEMHSDAAAQSMVYSLVVAELSNTMLSATQRFVLDSSPSAINDCSFANICTVHTNKVLIGVSESASLDTFSLTSTREAHKEEAIRLGFSYWCFTSGVCDGTALLFVNELDTAKVRILEVRDGAPLALQLLQCIDGLRDPLLWRNNGLLFSAKLNKKFDTDTVQVWHVSRGGRSSERLEGTPITRADNVHINCWCLLGEKIAICDWKTKDLAIYSCDLEKKYS